MNSKERALVIARLRTTGALFNVTLGTTSLLGEGMDLKNIDTLILATPISHPSRLIQILGRIGRDHTRDLVVIDINDSDKIFSKMYRKRMSVYRSLGYMFL
jgi:superfamily II DNA or RNA helicase